VTGDDRAIAKEHEPEGEGTVTASEFSFFALGLLLGVVSGAALIEFLRARPPAAHEVRLTVAHDAIPRRRASTLSDDAFIAVGPEPARGGPADRRLVVGTAAAGGPERRTTVRFDGTTTGPPAAAIAGAIPIEPGPDMPVPGRVMEPAFPLTAQPPSGRSGPTGEFVGIPISTGDDPVYGALRAGGIAAGVAGATAVAGHAHAVPAASAVDPVRPSTAVAVLDRPRAMAGRSGDRSGGQANAAAKPAATERCAEERRLAEERCELATRARATADAAVEALRVAQRSYDAHEATATDARTRADPRAVHAAKEAAQGGFRVAVASATTQEGLEAAARDWLTEINRINTDARDATTTATREHAATEEIGGSLERLGLEADAARIGAENADAACLSARVAVAECDERTAEDAAAFVVPPSSSVPAMPRLEEDETLGIALEAGGAPRIFRLLRGDRLAMTTLVASLAGDDPDGRRRWQLLLTSLVEAIIADAIEAAALDFPEGDPFWGTFTRVQNRDIAQALSSLGYRFDGLGGWTDGRYPSQRDLSLALGYAGLDPMRMRHWPNDEATTELFRDVRVAADEYLAGVAGDLTLGEMVTMLGRRADGLAEVWNQWGRIRPLLLDES
jgi:hypothetical protein